MKKVDSSKNQNLSVGSSSRGGCVLRLMLSRVFNLSLMDCSNCDSFSMCGFFKSFKSCCIDFTRLKSSLSFMGICKANGFSPKSLRHKLIIARPQAPAIKPQKNPDKKTKDFTKISTISSILSPCSSWGDYITKKENKK